MLVFEITKESIKILVHCAVTRQSGHGRRAVGRHEPICGMHPATSMALIYSNFLVSAIEVWNKAKNGKSDIEREKQELLSRCSAWNNEVGHLQGALHVNEDLAANDNETQLVQ